MAKAVGIDLGTTNSVVAVMEGGKPVVIANSEGDRTTPSVVAFPEDGQRLVGQIARRQAVVNPKGTITSAKRFIGRSYDEATADANVVTYDVVSGPQGDVRFDVRGKQYAPPEISAQVLRKLVEDASAYLGDKVTQAVVTVPAYFNDAQRQATKDAGKVAGIEVLRVVNEPTAAALAYGLEKKADETVLVFDLGGGTFDVSVLEVGGGLCEVKSTSGDTRLGGDDFDRVLVDWLAEDFRSGYGIDLREDRQALQRMLEAAEKAKCELSSAAQTTINLPFITADASGPKHLNADLTRAKFDQLTDDLVKRCLAPVEQALSDAGLTKDGIDEVILVGGSTRIPAVQALVKRLTGGKEPNMSVNPDEVVAVGASVQAGILQGDVDDILLLDVTPLTLGVETLGGVMTAVIERNTTIPARRSQVFSTASDHQAAVDIVVLQGERSMATDNRRLGQFRLEGIRPAPRGMPQIEVSFDIDANGILHVSARDKDTAKEQKITISGSTNLGEDEIDRMVKEAEANAEQDRTSKDQAEERNQADALAFQAEQTLSELGDQVPQGDRSRIEDLISQIRREVAEQGTADSLSRLTAELQQALSSLAAAQGPSQGADGGASGGAAGDETVDAEYTEL